MIPLLVCTGLAILAVLVSGGLAALWISTHRAIPPEQPGRANGTATAVAPGVVPAGEAGQEPFAAADAKPALTDQDLGQAVSDLESTDTFRHWGALDRLTQSRPHAQRDRVARAIAKLLQDDNPVTRTRAVNALGVWGTRDSVGPLMACLHHPDFATRVEALKVLGKCRDARVPAAVAERLAVWGFDRDTASKVLQEMGPAAEKAVIGYLTHQDAGVRIEACRILKAIGTSESLPHLQSAAADSNPQLAQEARAAAAAIAARKTS